MKILFVEDHPAVADLTLALLRAKYGHEVWHARDAFEALELAAELDPDLMLIDIGLPGMDGYELAGRLRQQPQYRKALLVALTGYAQHEDQQRAFAAGFDAHFAKPMDFAELVRVRRKQ